MYLTMATTVPVCYHWEKKHCLIEKHLPVSNHASGTICFPVSKHIFLIIDHYGTLFIAFLCYTFVSHFYFLHRSRKGLEKKGWWFPFCKPSTPILYIILKYELTTLSVLGSRINKRGLYFETFVLQPHLC